MLSGLITAALPIRETQLVNYPEFIRDLLGHEITNKETSLKNFLVLFPRSGTCPNSHNFLLNINQFQSPLLTQLNTSQGRRMHFFEISKDLRGGEGNY